MTKSESIKRFKKEKQRRLNSRRSLVLSDNVIGRPERKNNKEGGYRQNGQVLRQRTKGTWRSKSANIFYLNYLLNEINMS